MLRKALNVKSKGGYFLSAQFYVKIFRVGSLILKYTLVIKHAISQGAMISWMIF